MLLLFIMRVRNCVTGATQMLLIRLLISDNKRVIEYDQEIPQSQTAD